MSDEFERRVRRDGGGRFARQEHEEAANGLGAIEAAGEEDLHAALAQAREEYERVADAFDDARANGRPWGELYGQMLAAEQRYADAEAAVQRVQAARHERGEFTDEERRRGFVKTDAFPANTSWQGATVSAPRERVLHVLGEPSWEASLDDYLQDDDTPTTVSWSLMLIDGTPFRVYDHREGFARDRQALHLNIGARSASDSAKVVAFLRSRELSAW